MRTILSFWLVQNQVLVKPGLKILDAPASPDYQNDALGSNPMGETRVRKHLSDFGHKIKL